MIDSRLEFDALIGRLDRVLSEMLIVAAAGRNLDKADRKTLKHHAEDMQGAGSRVLELLVETEPPNKAKSGGN